MMFIHAFFLLLVVLPATQAIRAPTNFHQQLVADLNRGLLGACSIGVAASAVLVDSRKARADDGLSIDDKALEKNLFNIPPRLIEYPASFVGVWQTTMKFEGAKFTDKIPFSDISRDPNVAGFRKYSVHTICNTIYTIYTIYTIHTYIHYTPYLHYTHVIYTIYPIYPTYPIYPIYTIYTVYTIYTIYPI